MTTDQLQSLIDDINGQLNGVEAYRAINYMPDNIRTVGDTLLKAFCPYHHPSDPNEKIPTLTVDLKKKTFTCLKRGCRGNAGGSLIDLYAGVHNLSPLQAAVQIARQTGIEVQDAQLNQVGRLAFEEARQKRQSGAPSPETLALCEFALSITPDHFEALQLKAALCDDLDRREDALATVTRIVELAGTSHESQAALDAIESFILPKDPNNEFALMQAASLREKTGGVEQAIGYYLRVADLREEMNRDEENLNIFQRVVELAPDRLDLRLRLAGLNETLGHNEQAAAQYEFLAAAYEKKKEIQSAIEILQKLIALRPADLALSERLAALLQQSGNNQLAMEYWLGAAKAWQERESWDDALRCAGKALDIQPESLPAAQCKGEILKAAGRNDEARDHYIALFEMLDQLDDLDEAHAALILARDCAPDDVAVQRQITSWLTAQHRVDDAVEEMFRLAALILKSGQPAEGQATLRQISQLQPKNKTTRLRVAAAYEEMGDAAKAMDEYKDLGQVLLDDNDAQGAIEVFTQAAAADPDNPEIKRLKAQALEASGDTASALDLYLDAFHTFDAKKRSDEAEEAITRALDIDPARPEIHQTLSEFFLRAGRRADAVITLKNLLTLHEQAGREDAIIATAANLLELDPQDIEIRRRHAGALHAAGRNADAVREFHAAAKQLAGEGNADEAIAVYKTILEIDGDDLDALRQAAALTLQASGPADARHYFDRQLEVLKILEDNDAVRKLYEDMKGLYPREHSLKRELAGWLIESGHEDEGIKSLLSLAEDFQNFGELEEVARIYEQLTELKPDDQKFVAGLEEAYRDLGDFERAAGLCLRQVELAGKDKKRVIFWLSRLNEMQPENADYCHRLAEALEDANKKKDAVEAYRRLIALHEAAGDQIANVPILEKLLTLSGEDAALRLHLARSLEQTSQSEEACINYLIAVEFLIGKKDHKQARQIAEKVISLDRASIDAWNALVKCNQALGLTTELKQAWANLSSIHVELGEIGKAIDCHEQLKKLDLDDVAVGEALAALFEKSGNIDKAYDEYNRICRLLIDDGQSANALRLLQRMKQLRPADLDVRRNIIIMLEKEGHLLEAGDEALALGRALFQQKSDRDAVNAVRRAVDFYDDRYEKHHDAFDMMMEFDRDADGFALLLSSAQRALDNKEASVAMKFIERGLKIDEANRPLREFKIRLLLDKGDIEAAAGELVSIARLSLATDNAKEAEELLNECVKIAPKNIEAHQLLGDVLIRLKRPADAAAIFNTIVKLAEGAGNRPLAIEYDLKILEAEPRNLNVREHLANLYLKDNQQANAVDQFMLLAGEILKGKDKTRARDILHQVLRFDSSNLDCRSLLATLEWNAERYDEARTQYMNIITLLEKQGRTDDIAAHYEDLIKKDPEHLNWRAAYAQFLASIDRNDEAADQLKQLISLLEKQGRLEDALLHLGELERLMPETPQIPLQMGQINERLDDYSEAYSQYCRAAELFQSRRNFQQTLDAYQAALRLKPGDEAALTSIALLHEGEKHIPEAIEAYTHLARQYGETKDTPRQIDTYEKILTLDPLNESVLETLAVIYEKENNVSRASQIYLTLGQRHEDKGSPEFAIEIYKHLKDINPDLIEIHERLIRIYKALNRTGDAKAELLELAHQHHQLGDMAQAEQFYLELKALDPADPAILEHLAKFYESTGEIAKACQAYFDLAAICAKSGQEEKAVGIYHRIRVLDEENIDVAIRLFDIHESKKNWKALWTETERILDHYFTLNDEEQLDRWSRRLRETQPANMELHVKLADVFQSFNLFDRALAILRECAAHEIDNKRFKEAVAICQHGLGIDKRHVPLREILAATYLRQDAKKEAIAQYEQIAEIARDDKNAAAEEKALQAICALDDSHAPALRRLSDLLIDAGRTDEAVDMLSTLSTVYQMENKIDEAIKAYLDVLEIQPVNQPIRESLAELYLLDRNDDKAAGQYFTLAANARASGDMAKARHYLEKVIECSIDSIDAYRQLLDVVSPKDELKTFVAYGLKLAQLFRDIPALSDAAAVLQRILTHDPDNMAVMEQLAELLVESEDNAQAGAIYKRLGMAAIAAADDKRAKRCFEMMLSLSVEDPECLHKLGGIYERLKEPAQAAETLERAAAIYSAQQKFTEAVIVIQELISVKGDSPGIYETYAQLLIKIDDRSGAANQYALAAELHEQNGDTQAAIDALDRMFELDENRLEERLKYAGLLAQAGRVPKAIDQYHLASRLYEENNQIPAALNAALLAIKTDREDALSHRRAFDLYVKLGETAEAIEQARWLAANFIEMGDAIAAEHIINSGLELDDQDLPLHMKLAALHKLNSKADDASQEYIRSAELAIIARKKDTAIECLLEAKAIQPSNAILLRHLAGLYLDAGRESDYVAEMIAAANLLLEQGMIEDVTDLAAEMKTKLGPSVELRLALADNFEKQGEPILAAQEFSGLAQQLFQEEQYTRALDYVDRAAKLQPDNLQALETKLNILTAQNKNYEAFPILKVLAGIYQRQERWKDAEAALLQLHELGPNDPVPLKLLVEFYSLRGMKPELQERLHDLGQMYQDNDQIQEAVDAYSRLKSTFPDDIKALSTFTDLYAQIGSEHEILDDYMRLAELFSKTGAVMEATKIFERIILLDASSIPLREKFIAFLLTNGQKTRAISEMFEFARQCLAANQFRDAQRILKQAANLEPDDPQVYIQLAEAESRANSRGSAILNLHKAIKLLREEKDEAAILEVYDKLISLDSGDIDTRRERLTMLIELSRTEEAIEAALELADVYIRREFYDLAEELYLQIIEWNPQSHKAWTDLVHIREILGHHDDLQKDYLRWAEICIEADELEKALQCYKKITELDPENIDALRRYIDLYMGHGMEEELVEPYLRLADLHARRGEFDDAGRIFQRVMELEPANKRAKEGLSSTQEVHQKDIEAKGISRSEAEKAIWGDDASASAPPRSGDSLDAVITNYRNILELNPDNAQVRIKLAEVLEEKGDTESAIVEYLAASAIIQNGDPARAMSLCEKVLQLQPNNKIARDRLDKTVKKTDLFKALESAIDYSRTPDPAPGKTPAKKDKPITRGSSAGDSDIDEHHTGDSESDLDV